jgi:lysophospholipid acyltransferase (LPLAT)-like uncharacterized protein
MLKTVKKHWRQLVVKVSPFLAATVGKGIIRLILCTCRWEVRGLERFKETAEREKCILMLWHNRLAITASILYRFAPHFIYAALVSNSRDGELISAVIHSYKAGRTIRVAHNARHQALRELIRYLEEKKEIVIITPDGPRGPRYVVKPGIAVAALETAAHVIPFTWTTDHYWEFRTWDQLKLPKPFAKIQVSFEEPIVFHKNSTVELKQAQEILQHALPTDF